MKLEELLLSLTYVDHESKSSNIFDPVQIYKINENPITFRVENPKIDHWLDKVSNDDNYSILNEVLYSVDNVEKFISKVSFVLGDNLDDKSKAEKFDKLISLTTRARNQRGFYILWLLLAKVDIAKIKSHQTVIFEDINNFILKNERLSINEHDSIKDAFQSKVEEFWSNYI